MQNNAKKKILLANVPTMFLTFEPLKLYVLIYFVLKKMCILE